MISRKVFVFPAALIVSLLAATAVPAQEVAYDEGLIPYIPVDIAPDPPQPDAIIARIGPERQQP